MRHHKTKESGLGTSLSAQSLCPEAPRSREPSPGSAAQIAAAWLVDASRSTACRQGLVNSSPSSQEPAMMLPGNWQTAVIDEKSLSRASHPTNDKPLEPSDDLSISCSEQRTLQEFIWGQANLLIDVLQSKLQAHYEKMDVLSSNLQDYSDNIMEVLHRSCPVPSGGTSTATNDNLRSAQSSTVVDKGLAVAMQAQQQQMALLNLNLQKHYEQMKLFTKTNGDLRSAQRSTVDGIDVATATQDHGKPMDLLSRNLQEHIEQINPLHGSLDANKDNQIFKNKNSSKSCTRADTGPDLAGSDSLHGDSNEILNTDLLWDESDSTGAIGESTVDCSQINVSRMKQDLPHTSDACYVQSISHPQLADDQTNLFYAREVLASTNCLGSMEASLMEIQVTLEKDKVAQALMSMSWAPEPKRKTCFDRVVKSHKFEYFVCLIVAANTIFIAYDSERSVENFNHARPIVIGIIEIVFQVWFLLEILAKLLVHRWYFFANKDKIWNIMDLISVLFGIFDIIVTTLEITSIGLNVSLFRLLRLVRIFKSLRLVRVVRIFSELKVLLAVLTASLMDFFWCVLLLYIFIFMFATVFVDATAIYLSCDDANDGTKHELLNNFHSVMVAMLSLTKVATGGREWGPVADSLLEVGFVYFTLFIFFELFTFLAMMNILTGVFVDRTFKAAAEDRESLAFGYMQHGQNIVKDLILLYCAMTGEGLDSGATIDHTQFEQCMTSPIMRARLAALDLEIWDSQRFFKMLTSIRNHEVLTLKDWVTGCMQMRGNSSSIEVAALTAEFKSVKKAIRGLEHVMQKGDTDELDAVQGN